MKKSLLTLSALLICGVASARGENHTDTTHGANIVCSNEQGAIVLQFHSAQVEGTVEMADYTLKAKARFDDVGEMTIVNKGAGVTASSVRVDESLNVSVSNGSEAPVVARSLTRRGQANASIVEPNTKLAVSVDSYERRGESRMTVRMAPAAGAAIALTCKKVR